MHLRAPRCQVLFNLELVKTPVVMVLLVANAFRSWDTRLIFRALCRCINTDYSDN